VNPAPKGGRFLVTPTSGTAGSTSFAFSAPQWEDDQYDLPLTYLFYVITRDGLEIPLTSDADFSHTLSGVVLPHTTAAVGVHVFDSFGAVANPAPVVVTVSANQEQTLLSQAIALNKTGLTSAVALGLTDSVAQYFVSILGLLNDLTESSAAGLSQRYALRQDLFHVLTQHFVIGDAEDSIALKSYIVAQIAARPDELNSEVDQGVMDYVNALLNITAVQGISSDEKKTTQVGNLLSNAVNNAVAAQTRILIELQQPVQGKRQLNSGSSNNAVDNSEATLNSFAKLARSLLYGRSTAEPATVLRPSQSSYFIVKRDSVSSPTLQYSVPSTNITLPTVAKWIARFQGVQFVDSNFIVLNDNPYYHARNSSLGINSAVAILNWYDESGNKIEFRRMSQRPIVVSLANKREWRFESCQSWDDAADQWSSSGCKLSTESTSAVTKCECDHLTSNSGFASRLKQAPPVQEGPGHEGSPTPKDAAVSLADWNDDLPWWLILIVLFVAILTIIVLIVLKRGKRIRDKREEAESVTPSSLPQQQSIVPAEVSPQGVYLGMAIPDQPTYVNASQLYDRKSDSEDSVELRKYKLPPSDNESSQHSSSSESEIQKVVPANKKEETSSEESSENEVRRKPKAHEESSSSEDEELIQRKPRGREESSSEEEEEQNLEKHKSFRKEESSSEEESN
jgi:hypothetical protein